MVVATSRPQTEFLGCTARIRVGGDGQPLRSGLALRRVETAPDTHEDHVGPVAGGSVTLGPQLLCDLAGVGGYGRADPHGRVEPLGDPDGGHRGHPDDREHDGVAGVAGQVDGVADPLVELRQCRRLPSTTWRDVFSP